MGGRQGAVERIDLMHTVLAMPDNSVVSVPNGAIMTAPIVNFTARPTRRIELVFQVGFEDDPQRAVQLIDGMLSRQIDGLTASHAARAGSLCQFGLCQ